MRRTASKSDGTLLADAWADPLTRRVYEHVKRKIIIHNASNLD